MKFSILPRFSLGVLGLGTYFTAHWLMFWIVMAFPSQRKMDFKYNGYLNRRVLWLTMIITLLNAWLIVGNFKDWYSPMGGRLLSPFFQARQPAMYFSAILAITAGVAFTLVVLQLIKRYGIPFPVTCMVLWMTTFSFVHQLRPDLSIENFYFNTTALNRGPIVLGILLSFAVAIMILYIVIKVVLNRYKETDLIGTLKHLSRTLLQGEPPAYAFSYMSIAMLAIVTGIIIDNVGTYLHCSPEISNWYIAHPTFKPALSAILIIPSAFLVHRLFYNHKLRSMLGSKLGLEESPQGIRHRTIKALTAWCAFAFVVVFLYGLFRFLGWKSHYYFLALSFYIWDFVLLVLAVSLIRRHYKGRKQNFVCPVYSHGYNEPIYAVRSYLEKNGVPCRIMAEPYAFLYGYLIGPVAMKHLLVKESDSEKAGELLKGLPGTV